MGRRVRITGESAYGAAAVMDWSDGLDRSDEESGPGAGSSCKMSGYLLTSHYLQVSYKDASRCRPGPNFASGTNFYFTWHLRRTYGYSTGAPD